MTNIILATTSPYRQEAFRLLGLDFDAESSEVDENFGGRPEAPEELVLYLAKLKAEAVAKKHKTGIVIGFDSVGCFNGQILEKPKSREEAFARLKALSGHSHQFYAGTHVIDIETGKNISRLSTTNVQMRLFTDSEINKYLDQDPKFNTYSLGYNPAEFYSTTFISKMEGSYNSITKGAPIEVIVEMLQGIGYKL